MAFRVNQLFDSYITKAIEVEEPSGKVRLVGISLTRDSAPGLFTLMDFLKVKYGPDPYTTVLSIIVAEEFSDYLRSLGWGRETVDSALHQAHEFIVWMIDMDYLVEEIGTEISASFEALSGKAARSH